MENEDVTTVRTAYEAYIRGDLPTMLDFVDPDLEWTYLDPTLDEPEPQVCHGRAELEKRPQPGETPSTNGPNIGSWRSWRRSRGAKTR